MYNHAPSNYICPICLGVQGIENENTLIKKSDMVYQDDLVTAFVNSFFIRNNPGHVIIVPNQHYENIYDLPVEYAHHIAETSQKIALALKQSYKAEGITIIQNNEPPGNQHAFHYHLHVFPRYKNDELHKHLLDKRSPTSAERFPYARKVKSSLKELVRILQEGHSVDLIHRSKLVGVIKPTSEHPKVFNAKRFAKLVKALNLPTTTYAEREKRYRKHMMEKYGKGISGR